MSFPAALDEPPRVPLAHAPTPLERLERTSRELNLEVWVKRDDLTGVALSGNKVRKLEYLIAQAESEGARLLVTCGGVNSNHARATAVAAARRGLHAHLLLRGKDRRPPMGNLLLDRWVGARTTFIDPYDWPDKDARMAEIAAAHGAGFVIPEGGSSGLGAMGYVRAAAELADEARALGLQIARVVHACGSGGTTAGLALGFAALELEVEVIAVAVMADAEHFNPIVRGIISNAADRGLVPASVADRATFRVLDGFSGRGYAETTPEEMAALHAVARREGLVLDPVYTGKAFLPLAQGALQPVRGATVFLHTGGIFELFAFPELVEAVAEPSE